MKELTKEMREFIEDLQVFANDWVEEVQQVIVEHLDELFKDEAIRYLAKENRRIVEDNKKHNSNSLLNAYQFESEVIICNRSTYSDALYELCYKRYIKG